MYYLTRFLYIRIFSLSVQEIGVAYQALSVLTSKYFNFDKLGGIFERNWLVDLAALCRKSVWWDLKSIFFFWQDLFSRV